MLQPYGDSNSRIFKYCHEPMKVMQNWSRWNTKIKKYTKQQLRQIQNTTSLYIV